MRLDGVRIGAPDVPEAAASYATLLGIDPIEVGDRRFRFQLERGAVELEPGEPGVRAVCFEPEADDEPWPTDRDAYNGIDVVIAPAPVPASGGGGVGGASPQALARARSSAETSDRRSALTPRTASAAHAPTAAPRREADAATAIDHVVIFTPSPERAIALWRDRLGLRLAFDREFPERGLRLVFFRSGGMTLELACALPPPADPGPDRLYGVSYRVRDLAARRATLLAAGVDVSEIRPGHKTGTRVASVRSGTADVPTLLLEDASR